MTHPLDLLAPYVDGSLDPTERAGVDEHLRGCGRCRAEVDAAARAREAIRSLPDPAPVDLAASFTPERVAELRGESRGRGRGRAPWSKVVPALAAAAVVAVVALVVPRLGGSSDDAGTAADGVAESGLAAPAAADGELRLRLDPTDYDEESLRATALAFAASPVADAGGEALASGTPAIAGQLRAVGSGRTRRALACLAEAFPDYPGRIVEVRAASFRGVPAYLAFVVERPGAGEPPDTVTIWVASAEDCSILTLTSHRL